MKAVDLHIHTISTISDSRFEFSMDYLKEYVCKMRLDIIAITNHNLFDSKQFEEIRNELEITVLPGIEINFEGGHLLLISDANNIEDFQLKCNKVESKINNPEDIVTKSELIEIFEDIHEYLLIPHYPKKPSVPLNVIKEFPNDIFAIEVSSVKDFLREYKNNKEYTPLWFSDIRASKDYKCPKFGRVYLNIGDNDIKSIKYALKDRCKVSLSAEESNKLFPIDNFGFQISTGLNVVLGARSSGKSFFLDSISKSIDNVKYLKQFSLLDKKELDSRDFVMRLNNKYSVKGEEFLLEFKNIISDVANINLLSLEKGFDEYTKSLIKFATEEERRDSFSKVKLFIEPKIQEKEVKSIDVLISSIENLIINQEYKEILEKYLDFTTLKKLILELANKALEIQNENILKNKANHIISNIQERLQIKTTSNRIQEVDFKEYVVCIDKINKFNEICKFVKKSRKFNLEEIGKFKLIMNIEKYCNVSEIKDKVKIKPSLADAFKKYSSGFEYLQELKKLDIPTADYYKYYCNVSFDVLNEFDLAASGGERAEYNLLNEIRSALDFDILLIDEPESSFDNPFLKAEVNELIKDISNKMPVVVVTHNNTVGLSIKPDYLLYTSRRIINEKVDFDIYQGTPDSMFLSSKNGEKISTKDILMKSLEAGEEAYQARRDIYELHENR